MARRPDNHADEAGAAADTRRATQGFSLVIRQALDSGAGSPELYAVSQAALLMDIAQRKCTLEQLRAAGVPDLARALREGAALPVGSVEFVREAMRVAGVHEPPNMSYPSCLAPLLGRKLFRCAAGAAATLNGRWFIKPAATKRFTGFVYGGAHAPQPLDEHDREQRAAFLALDPAEEVWVSEPVRFLSETRFYVLGGQVIGRARYDQDGYDDAPEASVLEAERAIALLSRSASTGAAGRDDLHCSIDLGVLDTGATALVECNDAWALGLYGRSLHPTHYLGLLASRWRQLRPLAADPEALSGAGGDHQETTICAGEPS